MTDRTIYEVLQNSVRRFADRRALGYKHGEQYEYLTYQELWERVGAFRRGLAALGMRKGDRIAILSENRAEWAITDLASQSLGIVTVPIYSTLPAAQVQYVVRDSAARILVVSDRRQLAKALELRPNVRTLEHVVVVEGPAIDGVMDFAEVVQRGEDPAIRDAELDAQAATVEPGDIATLIYTSGTTGDPKGAMLTHRNLLHAGIAAREVVPLGENDIFLSFLPLCHIIERTGGHYLPLSIGALIVYSDGVFAVANELTNVRPTAFLCVPRLYENMQEKLTEHVAKLPERQRSVVQWAMRVGEECVKRRQTGRGIGPILRIQHALAERLALRRIREKATGGRIRFLVSGGAPLNPTTFLFFQALGVHILEGYGLTELPVIAVNRPGQQRMGTVGPPLPGIEVKIAPDGQILARGPSLMRGYFGKPDATAEAIDADGWFQTGDIGEVSRDGFLRITDRKKDIIVLANGKNVAPQPIEAHLKESPYIAEVVLLGDRASSIVAIVVPAFDRLRAWARDNELPTTDAAELVRRAETRKLVKDEIDRLSRHLADFERIKRFSIVDRPFSIEGGELTPTLKVKRKVVAQKYASLVDQMTR